MCIYGNAGVENNEIHYISVIMDFMKKNGKINVGTLSEDLLTTSLANPIN